MHNENYETNPRIPEKKRENVLPGVHLSVCKRNKNAHKTNPIAKAEKKGTKP
jgi:hypothetical protein